MSADIKVLPTPEREQCKADVIKLLEDLLEGAKRGEIVALAAVAIDPAQYIQTVHSKTDHLNLLIGATTILQNRLCKSFDA